MKVGPEERIKCLRTTDFLYVRMKWIPIKTPFHLVTVNSTTRHFNAALVYSTDVHIRLLHLSRVSSAEMKAIHEAVLESL